jgi:hypothetical protein
MNNEYSEGAIAILLIIAVAVGITLVVWNPDVERIGSFIYGIIK